MASRKNGDNKPKKEKSGRPHILSSPGDQTGCQLAGEALGTSESLLHSILDQSPYPMWIADDQGTLIWLNQACRDLLHLTAAEVVGKYNIFQDNIVEQQGYFPLLRRVFEQGETVRFELTYDTSLLKTLHLKTATSVILDVTVSPVIDGSGKITNAVFQHVDITDRKRAETALAESEQRFQTFMDHLPAAVFIKDRESRLLFANRYLREIFGWEDCLGKTTEELVPPELVASMLADDRRALVAGPLVNQERISDGHGVEHFFDTYKFPVMAEGAPVLLGGIAVDVTARQRAVEALELSEKKYRSFYQSILQGFVSVDLDGNIMEANQSYLEMLGYTAEEIQGLRYQDITPLNWHEFEANIVEQQILPRGYSDIYEKEYIRKDGTVFPIELRTYLIKDETGAPAGMWAFVRDITDRKQAEEALKKEKLFTEAILDSLPGTFFLLDSQGIHLRTNTSGLVASGYSLEELSKMHALDFIADEDKPAAQRALKEIFENGKASVEVQHLAKDGRKTPFLFTAKKFIIDDTPYILGTGLDITARKQSEEALRVNREYLKTLMESVGAGIVVVDAETRQIVDVNPFAAKIIDIPREDIIGNICHEHICPAEIGKCPVMDLGLTVDQSERLLLTGCGQTIPILKTVTHFQKEGRKYLLETFQDITERKKAEAALRESEEKFRSLYQEFRGILNTIPDTLCLISPDLRIVWGNEATASDIHQPSVSEIIGQHCYPLRHDRSEPCEDCPVLRCFRSGKMETEVTTAHGRIWELRAFPIYDDHDELRGAVEVARDITARQRMEEALLQSEARFRQVVESSPLPIGIGNDSGVIEYMNPKFVETFGYTLEDLPRMEDWFRLAYPDPAYRQLLFSKWQKAWERIKQDGATEVIEVEITCKDGSTRIMQIFGTLMENKSLVVFNDLTERKRAEIALRDSERRLSEIIDFLPDATFAIDLSGKVIAWNRAIEEMTGVKAESMIGKGDYEYALPFYGMRRPILIDLVFMSNAEIEKKYSFIKREGDILLAEAGVPLKRKNHLLWGKAGPLYDSAGKIVGAIEAIRDISERQRAEEERARLEAQMREVQKLESLGVLAGGIAHDFNNLLMVILGNADLALLALSNASPARPYVEEISRGSLRAADLCRQMLAYSGKGRFVIGRHDLSEIVREMAQMLKVSVSKKASLRYSFAADLPAVEVDATQMRQVIMNLIINASESLNDKNGFISVATDAMDCDRAFLAESYLDDNLPEGRYVYLEVADTGCGMDDDTRRRIFDPFFTTKFTGRGLGLAAVLGIVRGHQGAIKVYSEPGQGTTFKVLLPAVDWAPGDRAANTAPSTRPLPEGTILLVDDDPHIRRVGSQMLERLGFKVLTAAHGREGLEVFKANRDQIDCVILDLAMPEMAGDEVFRKLRRLRKDVRVILSSGFNEQDVAQRFAGKGVAGFIQKPYTVHMLRETLNQVLGPK